MNPLAEKVMVEAGVDISSHTSKVIEELEAQEFDYVVMICDNAPIPRQGRAINSDNGEVNKSNLPPHIQKFKTENTPLATLAEVAAMAENRHIRRILKITGGNKTKAAEILGVSRKTLWDKITSRQIET